MQAILAGSHHAVVEAVSTRVGREVAKGYVDPDEEQQVSAAVFRSASV